MIPQLPQAEISDPVPHMRSSARRSDFLWPLVLGGSVCLLLVLSFVKQLDLIDNGDTTLFYWLLVLGLLAGALLAFGPSHPVLSLSWLQTPSMPRVVLYSYGMACGALVLAMVAAGIVHQNGSPTLATLAWVGGLLVALLSAISRDALDSVRAWPTRCVAACKRGKALWSVLLLFAILLVAALLRVPALDTIPGYIHNDEASNGLMARSVADGQVQSLFSNGWASLPILGYAWDGLFFKLFGDSLFSLRFSSTVLGLGSIVVVALLGRELFNTRTGLLAAALLALFHYHIHFSRVGHHYIQALFAVTLTLYLLVLGLRYCSRLAIIGAGILLSVDIQVYYAARAAYAIVPLAVLYVLLVSDFRLLRSRLPLIGWLIVGWLVGVLPIGAFILSDWSEFTGRTREVIVFGGTLDTQNHVYYGYGTHDVFTILRTQLWRVLQTFNYLPDTSEQYGILRPMLDPVSGALLPTAVTYALLRIRHAGFGLCLIVLVCGIVIGGVLTIDPPFWPRLIIVAPFLALLIGAMLDGLWQVFDHVPRSRLPTALIMVAVFAAIGKYNYEWYFQQYQPRIHDSFIAAPMDLGKYLRTIPDNPYVYGITDGSFYVDHEGVQLLVPKLRSCNIVNGIDIRMCPGPMAKDSIFVVTPGRQSLLPSLEHAYPGGSVSVLRSYDLGQSIVIYRVQR